MKKAFRVSLPPGRYVLDVELFDPPAYLDEYVDLAFRP